MCEPATITAAALAIVGATLSAKGQADAATADANAFADNINIRTADQKAELVRQDGLQAQAADKLRAALQGQSADTQKQQLVDAAQKRTDAYNAATDASAPATGDVIPTNASAPKIIQDQVGKGLSNALTRARALATAKGQLEGFGDLQTKNRIDLANSGQFINTMNGQRRGSEAVLPVEYNAADAKLAADRIRATRKGQTLRTLGTLFQIAGVAAGGYAGMGAGAGSTAGGAATSAGSASEGISAGGSAFV